MYEAGFLTAATHLYTGLAQLGNQTGALLNDLAGLFLGGNIS